jgi:hypothetical protein
MLATTDINIEYWKATENYLLHKCEFWVNGVNKCRLQILNLRNVSLNARSGCEKQQEV